MIPQRTVNAFRIQNDISIKLYGIDCTIFIPTTESLDTAEELDIYATPSSYATVAYNARVHIEWSPNMYKLRKYGKFAEDSLPIIAHFPVKATLVSTGVEVEVDIPRHAYIQVNNQYVPENYEGTDEFEVVDIMFGKTHDSILSKVWKLAPRRV